MNAGTLRSVGNMCTDPAAEKESSLLALKKSGVRSTWLRLAVLEVMQNHASAMSVQDVFRLMQAQHDYSNLSAVYAALKTLASIGLLVVHIGPGRKLMYGLSSQGNVCFSTCGRCGKEKNILDPRIETFVGLICRDQGISLQHFRLQISSVCQACASGR